MVEWNIGDAIKEIEKRTAFLLGIQASQPETPAAYPNPSKPEPPTLTHLALPSTQHLVTLPLSRPHLKYRFSLCQCTVLLPTNELEEIAGESILDFELLPVQAKIRSDLPFSLDLILAFLRSILPHHCTRHCLSYLFTSLSLLQRYTGTN